MSNSPSLPVTPADIDQALPRVRSVLPVTPLTHAPHLTELVGSTLSCKWDLKFRTGSFKERGAVNLLLSLTPEQQKQGVCAASAGNHALALSYHAAKLRVPCTIIMPRTAPLVKIRHTERTGATVILEGSTFDEAYERAQALAKQEGTRFVSAFDDHAIIAGQGTAGLEILEQCPDLDTIVVPVGGGGLASGIALAVKARRPEVMIIGVQSEWVLKSRAESKPPSETAIRPVTIADGIAVKRVGTLTGPIIGALLDSLISVNEGEIANGILRYLELERTMVEGAGAAALAAILAGKLPKGRRHTVVLACGGNIDMNVLSRLIERDMAQLGRLLKVVVSAPDRPGSLHRISGALSAQGANVLEVQHDRSFSKVPGNVDITFSMEVRDNAHKLRVLEQLRALGVEVRETTMLSTER